MEDLLYIGLSLLATIVIYLLSVRVFNACHQNPFLHPLIISCTSLITLLYLFDLSIQSYQGHSQVLVELLSLATVALGLPLYKNLSQLKQSFKTIYLPLLVGAVLSPMTAIILLLVFGVDQLLINSMVSKAITSPIAIDITLLTNGIPAIAVIFVILSGIIGSAVATPLFNKLQINHEMSKGIALGVSAHAIGTARAFQISPKCAAFSVLAMCLNGLITTVAVVLWLQVY
jgi:putative effector of murein hydrolase